MILCDCVVKILCAMENQRKNGPFIRRPIIIMRWFLFTLGINISKTENVRREMSVFIIVTSLPFSCVMSTSAYAYVNRHDFDKMMKVAAYFSTCTILVVMLLDLFFNKTKIKMLIDRLDENVYHYPDEENMEVRLPTIFKDENSYKMTIIVLYYACFGFILAALSPFFGFLITGVYETSIYPSWFPWSQEGFLLQCFTLVYEGCVVFMVFWICYTFELFLIFLVVEFLKQYKRLCVAISTMHSRTNKLLLLQSRNDVGLSSINATANSSLKNNPYDNEVYNQIYRQKIIQCIEHYQEIQRLFKLFKPWFIVFFSIELFFSMLTFALIFYNILTSYSDASYLLTFVGSTINVIALLFCRCFVGEMFSGMNIDVLNTIFYKVNWSEQSKSNKQLLMVFHILAKRPHLLTAFSTFPASYYTFAGLLRLSYSYFSLLKTTLEKDSRTII